MVRPVRISPVARKEAAERVAAARAARRKKRQERQNPGLAERLEKLSARAAGKVKAARRTSRWLGSAIVQATRHAPPGKGHEFVGEKSVAALDARDMAQRVFLETVRPLDDKTLTAVVAKSLGLRGRDGLYSIRPLYPRLRKRRPELGRFHVLQLAASRRGIEPFRQRLLAGLRRSGAFVSVRAERAAMGLASAPPDGQGYTQPVPDHRDWFLTAPDDHDGADFRGCRGAIDVYGAWDELDLANNRLPGEGVKIGHPDSGFRIHAAYPEAQIDLANAYNAFLGSKTPAGVDLVTGNFARHPLQPRNLPYFVMHGSHTASVIVAPRRDGSRPQDYDSSLDSDEGAISGVAPGATMLPLRCADTVVLAGDLELCSAIEQAIDEGVDIISISLGGSPAMGLRELLAAAVEEDIIVVAAAGQSNGIWAPQVTAAPAAYPEVIACGGSIGPLPWEGCFSGPEIDICAPAVDIWGAGFSSAGDERLWRMQGTSFATAIVAGMAALWLHKHGGRKAVTDAVPGVPLQQVFRHLLRETSVDPTIFADDPPPGGWRHSQYGAGLVNVRALVRRQLPAPEDVPPFDESLPFNVYAGASGIAFLDVNARPVLDGIAWMLGVPEATATAIGAGVAATGDFFAALADGASTAAGNAMNGMLTGIGNLSRALNANTRANVAAAAWEETLAAALSVGGEVGAFLQDAADTAEEAWEEAEEELEDALEETGDAVEEFIEDTGEFLEEAAEDAGEAVGEAVGGAVGAVADAFGF